jgi:hypothetical protein
MNEYKLFRTYIGGSKEIENKQFLKVQGNFDITNLDIPKYIDMFKFFIYDQSTVLNCRLQLFNNLREIILFTTILCIKIPTFVYKLAISILIIEISIFYTKKKLNDINKSNILFESLILEPYLNKIK